MKKQWIEINMMFLDHASRRHDQSTKSTIEAEGVIVTEVDESMLPKFDAEDGMKDHVAALKC